MSDSKKYLERKILAITAVWPDTENEILVILTRAEGHFEISTEEKQQQGDISSHVTLTKISAGADEKEARALFQITVEQIRSVDPLK